MSHIERDKLLHQINLISGELEDRWLSLTNKQVLELKAQVELIWETICRRKKA